ncbi:hypothetical protein CYMTET_51349 [Cymbomonas tetramitiformis]|uniref:Uncharacterized protein n=1 Tax=Cymbomonas tetramitiformis TaxID=36881 RepID=A0AAE0BMG8_9CHLO|nr:hypothetical protein CYMTET_51349 [Cymbomonas tetramitiformis]
MKRVKCGIGGGGGGGGGTEGITPPTADRVAQYQAHRREFLCAQKRRKTMKAVLFAESVPVSDSSALPATLQILKRTPRDHLLYTGQIVSTRAAALLKIAEVEERDGKLPQFEALVPIATQKLVENKHSYSHKQLKTDLQQYISLEPPSSLVANVMSKAKGKLLGDPVGELAKLPVLADMLRAQGHGCQLVTLSSAQMLEVLIEVEHKEFLYEQKSKPVGERQSSRADEELTGGVAERDEHSSTLHEVNHREAPGPSPAAATSSRVTSTAAGDVNVHAFVDELHTLSLEVGAAACVNQEKTKMVAAPAVALGSTQKMRGFPVKTPEEFDAEAQVPRAPAAEEMQRGVQLMASLLKSTRKAFHKMTAGMLRYAADRGDCESDADEDEEDPGSLVSGSDSDEEEIPLDEMPEDVAD